MQKIRDVALIRVSACQCVPLNFLNVQAAKNYLALEQTCIAAP